MTSITFKEILDSVYDRVDDLDIIIPSLSEIQSKLPFDSVYSCVSVGCGYGRLDLIFMEHFMRNVSEFIAVEPDPVCAAELRMKLPEKLPNVKSIVCEEMVQSWPGVNQPVDAVLLIHFLYYLNPAERLALCRRLHDNVVHRGGFVFVLIHPHHTSGEPSAYCRVIQQLKSSERCDEFVTDREVCDTMLSTGFELCFEQMYTGHMNVEEPDDALLSLFLRPDGRWDLDSVRHAAREVFGHSKRVRHDSWLGIFRKP